MICLGVFQTGVDQWLNNDINRHLGGGLGSSYGYGYEGGNGGGFANGYGGGYGDGYGGGGGGFFWIYWRWKRHSLLCMKCEVIIKNKF